MEEKQTNYTINENFELPSKGKIYGQLVNPIVTLRSMSARDEMKRLAPTSMPLKVLADIIEDCMIEKPAIHVYDMAVGDYEFLLHKLRIVTYGPEYKMAVVCPNCNEVVTATVDLDTLEVMPFDEKEFANLCVIELPRSKRTVSIKYSTPRILDTIEAETTEFAKKYKDAELNFEILAKLKNLISAVDGIKLKDYELEDFINKLPAMDVNKILNTVDKLNNLIGLNTTVTVKCPNTNCGGDIKTTFRFGPEFFRPTNI